MLNILKLLRFGESLVATAAYAVVAVLLMSDVIGRELLGQSLLGAEQLAVYGAIIAGFLGLTLATSDNAHLRPKFLDFAAGKYSDQVERIGDLVSAMVFMICCYIAMEFVLVTVESGDRAPVLYFLLWPLRLILPYAFASAAIKHLIFFIKPMYKATSTGLAS